MRWAAPALLVLAVILANAPLLLYGFGDGHDAPLELVRVIEYREALRGGQHPPFWAPDLYGGRGSPIFLYYAPGFALLVSLLMPVVPSAATASVIVLVAFSALGTFLMWRLVLEAAPQCRAGAAAAAVLFALQPYLLGDKWLRNANAEFLALSLLPAVLLGAVSPRLRRAFVTTALSLAGIILTHNITALVATALAIGIAVVVRRAVVAVIAGVAAAIGVTAFFWYPALTMRRLVRPEELVSGKFDFHLQFPTVASLFGVHPFYAVGPLAAILLLIAIVRARDRIVIAFVAAAVVVLFFVFPVSTPLWETLPFLRFAQFPWRLAGPFSILVCAAAGAAIRDRQLAAAVIALGIVSAIPNIRAYRPYTAPEPSPIEIASRGSRTTVYDEYLPRTAGAPFPAVRDAVIFRKWFFPVWTASVDSQMAALIGAPGGLAAVRVPPGKHNVRLQLTEPVEREIGKGVSAIAVALVLLLALLRSRRVALRSAGN